MKTSVALCTYNGEKYIKEQLDSILKQTVKVDEIVVGDDGSTDNTLTIVQEVLSNSGIPFKVMVNPGPKGVSGNFYNTISACSNEIVFTCDQDDVWVETKVEEMLKCFNENEKALLVFSDATLVDGALKPINCNLWKTIPFKPLKDNSKMFDLLLGSRVVTGACMAVKRDFAVFCGVARGDWLHDAWFAINASVLGDIVPLPEQLTLYRQHGNNTIGASNITSSQRVKGYFKNFEIMPAYWGARLERYTTFKELSGDNLTSEQLKKLDKCIGFWKDLTSINECNKFKGLCIVIKNYFNFNYRKYYSGCRGAIRDFLVVLFRSKR